MTDRPTMNEAIGSHLAERQEAADAAAAPEREAREAQQKADAALYGTAGWESLGYRRREMAAGYVRRQQAAGGGTDAA
ncbi:hypothetical protein OG292_22435 [Streptomyces sp. NBC_01511]|uniref:hypothetical protein n=1 Tax=Streptomyces sp. NBC_01511 TaxID=2903889 RepID=UPI0038674F35